MEEMFDNARLYEQATVCRWSDASEAARLKSMLEPYVSDYTRKIVGSFWDLPFDANQVVEVVNSSHQGPQTHDFAHGSLIVLKAPLRYLVQGEVYYLTEDAGGEEKVIHSSEVREV